MQYAYMVGLQSFAQVDMGNHHIPSMVSKMGIFSNINVFY